MREGRAPLLAPLYCVHSYQLVCLQVVDSLLVGEADARVRNKIAADLVNAFSSLRNKHATLHGVK